MQPSIALQTTHAACPMRMEDEGKKRAAKPGHCHAGNTSSVPLQVVDEGKKRAVTVEKEGFPDAVVWNPWIEKAAGMADFGDEEYKVSSQSGHQHMRMQVMSLLEPKGQLHAL